MKSVKKMSNLLFVYGTLMNNISSTIAQYLHNNSNFLGIGSFLGKLYDLGHYPGAIYDAQANSMVQGQVFSLYDAVQVLEKLDYYEGILPIEPNKNEYRRELVPVNIQEKQLNCWVYVYNFPTDRLIEIPDGHYLNYLKTNEAHQNFIKTIDFEDFSS